MSDPQPPPSPPNVTALVDAIDVRAKQAGTEAANEVMQRMLGSVADVLKTISDRLDHVEELLASGGAAAGDGGAGATPSVVEAIQSGLTSFNARLGRLEEAFVQAVDDSGAGTQSVVDEVRAVVSRALEEAVPAGKKAPALDPETREALARVESALGTLAEGASSTKPVEDALQLALSAVGERIDAVEQRVVAAVQDQPRPEPPPPPAPVDLTEQLSPVLDRLDYLERRLMEWTKQSTGTTIEDAFELVQVRIAGLEQLVRTRASERQDSAAEVRAAMAPAMEQLQAVESGLRSNRDDIGRVDAALAALPGRFQSLEERVWAVVQSLADGDGRGVDAALLTRFEEAVERLDRDEATARIVRLIEERMSAGLRAVTERTDEVRRSLESFVSSASATATASSAGAEDVKSRVESLTTEVRGLSALPEVVSTALAGRLTPLADRVGGLDARLDSLDARVAGIDETVGALHTSLDSIAAMRLRLDEVAGRPTADVGVLSELRSRMDELSSIQVRLGELSAVLPMLDELVGRPAPVVDVDLGPIVRRLDELSSSSLTASDVARAIDERLGASPAVTGDDLSRALGELRSTIDGGSDDGLAAAIASLQSTVTELSSSASGELVADAIEALQASVADRLAAMERRLSEQGAPTAASSDSGALVADAIEALQASVADRLAAMERRLSEQGAPTAASSDSGALVADAIEALQASVADRLAAMERRLSEQGAPTAVSASATVDVSRIEDLVRRETELLTQRVAALAVGVEATRALVEQQQNDAENRIGRKAGEVTRRLAADFGIRTKRGPGSGGRRDPRELGP